MSSTPAAPDSPQRSPGARMTRTERLDRLPFTKAHGRLLVGSGVGWALDAMDVGLISFVMLALAKQWQLSTTTLRWIASISSHPQFLLTTNPNVKTLADFSSVDKIALPAVRISNQAVMIQMAAIKQMGQAKAFAIDPFTISMGHGDAMAARRCGGGRSEVRCTHCGKGGNEVLAGAVGSSCAAGGGLDSAKRDSCSGDASRLRVL